MSLDYDPGPGPRWCDHTARILALQPGILAGVWHYRADGLVCTWVLPWDRQGSLALTALDPFFIEVCRAVRLVGNPGSIQARGTTSKGPRIAAKEALGDLGDPWTPINQKKDAALTVSGNGLTPELMRDLIFQDGFALTGLQLPAPSRTGQDCRFTAAVLVRGRGTTDGFHQAAVPIPSATVTRMFGRGPERDRLAALSKTAIGDSGVMQNKVLKFAIYSLLEAGPKQVNFEKREVSAWWDSAQREFAAAWSADFFPWLWRSAEDPDERAARLDWLPSLRAKAEATLHHAIASYPAREGRRYRAQVRAEGLFRGLLFKQFPDLKETQEPDHDDTRNG